MDASIEFPQVFVVGRRSERARDRRGGRVREYKLVSSHDVIGNPLSTLPAGARRHAVDRVRLLGLIAG
jgi:hypothetical protein